MAAALAAVGQAGVTRVSPDARSCEAGGDVSLLLHSIVLLPVLRLESKMSEESLVGHAVAQDGSAGPGRGGTRSTDLQTAASLQPVRPHKVKCIGLRFIW